MEIEPKEQQIVELLSKLKNQGGTYPKKLLAARRDVFLSQVASVGLGLGIGAGLKTVTKSSKGGSLFHLPLPSLSASSLIETVLVIAIVAQASVIAYNYRNRIADLFNSFSKVPTPSAVIIPVTGTTQTDVVISDTPTVITTVTATLTASPSSTATTDASLSGSSNSNNGTNTNPNVTLTPVPPTKDNNGNHFGQTPKPPQQESDPKPTKNTKDGKKP